MNYQALPIGCLALAWWHVPWPGWLIDLMAWAPGLADSLAWWHVRLALPWCNLALPVPALGCLVFASTFLGMALALPDGNIAGTSLHPYACALLAWLPAQVWALLACRHTPTCGNQWPGQKSDFFSWTPIDLKFGWLIGNSPVSSNHCFIVIYAFFRPFQVILMDFWHFFLSLKN